MFIPSEVSIARIRVFFLSYSLTLILVLVLMPSERLNNFNTEQLVIELDEISQ